MRGATQGSITGPLLLGYMLRVFLPVDDTQLQPKTKYEFIMTLEQTGEKLGVTLSRQKFTFFCIRKQKLKCLCVLNEKKKWLN